MNVDKPLILSKIKEHYSFKKDSDFARFLEIKPQTLASWYTRNTFDIELLYSKCGDIDGNFLLTGKGNMLRIDNSNVKPEEEGSRNWIEEVNRLSKENCALQETNELLRFKIGVLEKESSEVKYTQRDPIIYESVAEAESELIKKKTKQNDDAKK